jgi:DNA-binding MarR family transcriptional regulator
MSRGKPQQDLKEAMALTEELRPALQRLFRQLRREGQDLGISPLHALLLAALREHPGIGVSELARLEKLRGPTISGHVKAMEALGLIERKPSHPDDRRRVGLVVSKKGTAIIEAIKRSKTAWLAQRLAALSPEAREAIRNAIAPLNEIVR